MSPGEKLIYAATFAASLREIDSVCIAIDEATRAVELFRLGAIGVLHAGDLVEHDREVDDGLLQRLELSDVTDQDGRDHVGAAAQENGGAGHARA